MDQPVNGLSATAQINITVLDVNDNNPQYSEFQNPIVIPEDKTGDVTQIQVTDRDIGLNGEVTVTTSSYSDVFGFKMVRGVNTFERTVLLQTCVFRCKDITLDLMQTLVTILSFRMGP